MIEKKKKSTHELSSPDTLDLIKTTQSLPDEVVTRFLQSKGSLKKSDFKTRVLKHGS